MEYSSEYRSLRPGGTLLTRQLLSLGGELKNRRVLKLAAAGETAALLAREFGASIIGVDLSEARISECREKYPELTFMTADAKALPFGDGSFDVLVSECSFSVFSDPQKAFREAGRVLVPQGKLLLSDLWQRGGMPSGKRMVRSLYTRETWLDLAFARGSSRRNFWMSAKL